MWEKKKSGTFILSLKLLTLFMFVLLFHGEEK